MKLWLYIHFPALQLNTLYCDRDTSSHSHHHAGQDHSSSNSSNSNSNNSNNNDCAVVIVEGQRNMISQLNQAARAAGVKKGMGLATAASLCSDLQVHAYDEACEKSKLKEIAHWLYLLTSDISFFEPNGLLLQISNMLTLYDGLQNYWRLLSQHLDTLQYDYTYATGYSPFAARILARRAVNTVSESEIAMRAELELCTLRETGISSKQVEKLERVGVHSIKDLMAIQLTDLAKRFDVELVNYVGRLSGKFNHPVNFYIPPEAFDRCLDLLFEIENTQYLEKPLLKLLGYLEVFLKLRDQHALELLLILELRDEPPIRLTLCSAAGEYLKEKWLNLFQLKFESLSLNAPVKRIQLQATRVQPRSGQIADLFEGAQGKTSPLELVSMLRARLGEQAVHGVTITHDPRPHMSSQYCMPLMHEADDLERDSGLLRPSILLPQPQPLRQKISIMQGPERLATGWWDAQPIVRDYFIARAANGSWLWVFRTPEQQWFLHGVFS